MSQKFGREFPPFENNPLGRQHSRFEFHYKRLWKNTIFRFSRNVVFFFLSTLCTVFSYVQTGLEFSRFESWSQDAMRR